LSKRLCGGPDLSKDIQATQVGTTTRLREGADAPDRGRKPTPMEAAAFLNRKVPL
jgi:hypothetical protein